MTDEEISPAGDASAPEPSESAALRLDHFLKLTVGTETGGQAKWLIQNGDVKVNGAVETRRRRKLSSGDVVELAGKKYTVDTNAL